MPDDRPSVSALASRLETAIPATVLLGQMWWYALTILYPARALKAMGLYRPNAIGKWPTYDRLEGQGQFYCHRHREPVYLDKGAPTDDSIAYFDMISTIYAMYIQPFTRPLFEETVDVMKPLLPSHARILDTSCGPGTEALQLSTLVPHGEVIGMDLSAGMVATACDTAQRRGIRNVAFFQADVADMPQHFTGRFDATFCFAAFHHYPDPHRAVSEMRRVLTDRGIAFVVDPGPAWVKLLGTPIARWGDPGWVSFYTAEEFRDLFIETGFAQFYWSEVLPGFGMCIAAKSGAGP